MATGLSQVINANADFVKRYRFAAPFVDSGHLWTFCMTEIEDPGFVSTLCANNAQGISPVQTFLIHWTKKKYPQPGFKFTKKQINHLGCLFGYIFQFIFGCKKAKKRDLFLLSGAQSAALFTPSVLPTLPNCMLPF